MTVAPGGAATRPFHHALCRLRDRIPDSFARNEYGDISIHAHLGIPCRPASNHSGHLSQIGSTLWLRCTWCLRASCDCRHNYRQNEKSSLPHDCLGARNVKLERHFGSRVYHAQSRLDPRPPFPHFARFTQVDTLRARATFRLPHDFIQLGLTAVQPGPRPKRQTQGVK